MKQNSGLRMEPINGLAHDLLSIIEKYDHHRKRFEEFYTYLNEGDHKNDIFRSLSVSGLEGNEFSIEFLDRSYRVTFSLTLGNQLEGTASCYLANTFPDSGFSLVDTVSFGLDGQADILDSSNKPYRVNARRDASHILFHWLRLPFIDGNNDEPLGMVYEAD